MYPIFWNVHAGMDSFTKNSASRLHDLCVGFCFCQNCHILIGVYPTITYTITMFRFVSGGYDCRNNNPWTAANRVLEKYFKHGNEGMCVRCDDFGRCWEVHCAAVTKYFK